MPDPALHLRTGCTEDILQGIERASSPQDDRSHVQLLDSSAKAHGVIYRSDRIKNCIEHIKENWKKMNLIENRRIMMGNSRIGRSLVIFCMADRALSRGVIKILIARMEDLTHAKYFFDKKNANGKLAVVVRQN